MAKKTKDTGTSTAKKETAPVDPAKTRSLVRLLNILALLLAIAAFLLQLFAVLSHHWKWQSTKLHPLDPRVVQNAQTHIYDDSRLDQNYGLYSREVKVFADNDQHLDQWASTRFPRPDETEDVLHQCLSRTSSLRGALLACLPELNPPQQCHCRRYAYWSWVIFFEILALVLLGLVVVLVALFVTDFGQLLKLAAAGLSALAFLALLIGLILILSHLKRETRSIADAYPHLYQRLSNQLAVLHEGHRAVPYHSVLHHSIVRRQQRELYRNYPLSQGQHPYNETHFQEFSERLQKWIQVPYTTLYQRPLPPPVQQPLPLQQRPRSSPSTTRRTSTSTTSPAYNAYGPIVGYDRVFEHTNAGIGWSTVLSILALILSLLVPAIAAFSWLKGKTLAPEKKTTTTTTTVKTEYVPIPQTVTGETTATRTIPSDYDSRRPITDAVVTSHHTGQNVAAPSAGSKPIPSDYDPRRPITDAVVTAQHIPQKPFDAYATRTEPGTIVRDVVISDEQRTPSRTTQEHPFQVQIEPTQRT